jgi:NitT/TauT family transport system substrate-binding protein
MDMILSFSSSSGVDMETLVTHEHTPAKRGFSMNSFSISTLDSMGIRLGFAAAALAAVLCGHAEVLPAASAPTPVAIAYPSPSPRVAPLWLAQDLGFFGKYGLRADAVLVRNNQMLTAGYAAGDINMAYTGGTTVLGVTAAGAEARMVVGFVSRGHGFLTVKPELRKPADLAGKRFGVQSIGGTLWMYAMLTLEELGLDASRDRIQFIVVGNQTVMIRSLETGLVDAAVLTTRTFSLDLKKKGFNVMAEVFPAMASTGVVARKDYLEKNPAVVESALKALIEAEYYMLAPSGKAQTVKTIMNRLKLSDPALAEEGYADVVKEFERRPYPSLDGLKNMQRLLAMQNPKLAQINPAQLIDSSILRKLESDGFLAQLQKRYRE